MSLEEFNFVPMGPVRFLRRKQTQTPIQRVRALDLADTDSVLMPDGIVRRIRKISSIGEVFVHGVRGCINVYAITKVI